MPVIIDSYGFDLIPNPDYGSYDKIRISPKIKFKSKAGYEHRRNAFPQPKYKFELGWSYLTTEEMNTLEIWIAYVGAKAFYYIVPDVDFLSVASGDVHLVQITSDEISIKPSASGYYSAKLTLEDV
jgi:hypothetical protein